MFLSSRQMKAMSRLIKNLAEPFDEREVRERVAYQLLDLLDAQFVASFVWNPNQNKFEDCVELNMDPENLKHYTDYFQYHDPITPKMQQHRSAVRATDVLDQSELMRTEFFNDFLKRDGLNWGINLFAWDGAANIGDLRVWRDRSRENFSNQEVAIFDLIRPGFIAALKRCHQPAKTSKSGDSPCQISTLSPREYEIASLAACGMADKEIARQLHISITTVRTHLKNSFQKLGVHNRMSLVRRLSL